MLELNAVEVRFKDRTTLQIPHLRFEEGRTYGIIGENGSGKTTLLRLLAGTLAPTSGQVLRSISRDNLAYLPQSPYSFSFSVLRSVSMGLPRSAERKTRATEALAKVGLSELAGARGDRLSGGEAQRMGLARVIALPRRCLILDEPTSATDIRGMDRIETVLREYARETGCLLIFSTHAPAQALRLAEEVIFLEKGQLVEMGSASQLLRHPQDERTRSFLKHWQLGGVGGTEPVGEAR